MDELAGKVLESFNKKKQDVQIKKSGSIGVKVKGNERHLERVFVNLISNAVKYSPKDSKINIHLSKKGKNAIISVEDSGVGIAKGEQEKVFDRFYRTSNQKKDSLSGFGLGLYIVREIVLSHGGKIWVESQKGKGSTFYFTIPLA
jgi:signal transduction histidine kinase